MFQQTRNDARCPPPRNFHPAGTVHSPKLELTEPMFKRSRSTEAQAAGIRYERKAQAYLCTTFPHHYIAGPWFSYQRGDEAKRIWCQPDGLLIDIKVGYICLIEIKLRHTSDAWWQTRHLYLPVIKSLFGEETWRYGIIEVVRWYDPDIQFPERYKLVPELNRVCPEKFGVHIWKPRAE